MQSKVDAFYGMFVKSVARSRGTSQATVRSGFGQGRMVLAADALKERMVDRVETIDETFARLGAPTRGNQRMAAATSPALLSATGDPWTRTTKRAPPHRRTRSSCGGASSNR